VLQQFTLTLNQEGKKLALCTFGTSSVQYDHYDETLALKVTLSTPYIPSRSLVSP
jgi:hypothetical protein